MTVTLLLLLVCLQTCTIIYGQNPPQPATTRTTIPNTSGTVGPPSPRSPPATVNPSFRPTTIPIQTPGSSFAPTTIPFQTPGFFPKTTVSTLKGTYVAVVPSLLRPGRDLDISVQILDPSLTVSVMAKVYYENTWNRSQEVIAQTTKDIKNQDMISIKIPGNATRSQYKVLLSGSGSLTFKQYTQISTDFKTLSMFIQTDKGVYKPGTTVRFRVMGVYSDLLPYDGTYNITIEDPYKSKIKQWLSVSGPSGVFSGKLQLSEQPVLGDWTIHVKTNLNGKKEKMVSFKLAEYVLPKFEVKLTKPPYMLAETKNMPVTVKAMYTYGQPVKGTAVISVKIKVYGTYEIDQYGYIILNRTLNLKKGVASTTFTRPELLLLAGNKTCTSASCFADDESLYYYALVNAKLMYKTLIISAVVTDEITNNIMSTNATVEYVNNALTMKFLEFSPSTFKPGLNWTGMIQITKRDGATITLADLADRSGKPPMVQIQLSCSVSSGPYFRTTLYYSINSNGMADITFQPTMKATRCSLSARYKYVNSYKSIQKFLSKEQQGIQVSLPGLTSAIKVNSNILFNVAVTQQINGFYYQLMSKGRIVKQDYIYSTTGPTDMFEFPILYDQTLCRKSSPSARMLAWYITDMKEIIVDSIDFNVDGAFANNVSIQFSKTSTKPGSNISLTVQASPESYVGLLAVDQSVLLLGRSNDITQDKVMKELRMYDSSRNSGYSRYCCYWYWPIYSGGKDTSEVLKNAGVSVLTDSLIFKDYPYYTGGPVGMPGPEFGTTIPARTITSTFFPTSDVDEARPMTTVNPNEPLQEPSRVRTEFPETWIWTEEIVDGSGQVQLQTKVPDTITSWTATAFALSQRMGLGITKEATKLTVIKPFFVSLNLPYSVIRGEEIALQVTVFNYMQYDIQVVVTLEASDLFMVRQQNQDKPTSTSVDRTVNVISGDGVLVSFWIVPVTIGPVPISVKARSSVAADAVERTLLVEPEGEAKEFTRNVLINHGDMSKTYMENITIEYPPENVVNGSERILFTVIGDMMGPSINGLDKLLRLPTGCGEQNMVKFAPNIYILQYLEATTQLTDVIKNKAIDFLEKGYQRELTYRRTSGSYSAFGERDKAGSMWLTTFVIKSFEQAKQYITIDSNSMNTALDWIVRHQKKTGDFAEPPYGRVIQSSLQGGSSKGISLTAYVLTTLLELKNGITNMYTKRNVETAIVSATLKLEQSMKNISSDPYSLSIVTYALTLANSAKAAEAKTMLDALKTMEGDATYWKVDTPEPVRPVPYWRRYYYQAPSYDIEMTAYALLTYTKLGLVKEGMAIANWLGMQRNSLGGYRSTQDTVVALQALSAFESIVGNRGNENMAVSLVVDGNTHNYNTIKKENIMILQSYEISSKIQNVELTATGTGMALFQMSVFYHLTSVEEGNDIEFIVSSNTIDNGNVMVNACGRWKHTDPSGMVVVEVNMLTAYKAITDDLLQVNKDIGLKRFEENEKGLILYLDELPTGKLTCINITSVNTVPVSNLKEAVANIYQYYNPGEQMSSLYLPSTLKDKQVCTSCEQCCEGITSTPPTYIDTDNCASMPCQNGGQCIDDFGSYMCKCRVGYTGQNCQVRNGNQVLDDENRSSVLYGSVLSVILAVISTVIML